MQIHPTFPTRFKAAPNHRSWQWFFNPAFGLGMASAIDEGEFLMGATPTQQHGRPLGDGRRFINLDEFARHACF
jgi:hypothetical protein